MRRFFQSALLQARVWSLIHSTRLLVAVLISPASAAFAAPIEMAGGLALLEEGDDRLRPAVALRVGLESLYSGSLYYWGRDHGPVSEKGLLVHALRRFTLFNIKELEAGVGIAVMDEMVEVSYPKNVSASNERDEHNINAGGAFSISAKLPKIDPFYAAVSWDSHIFPAGIGGILLASGRKQTITLLCGWTL